MPHKYNAGPEDKLIVIWDGASYHRACVVRQAAEALQIDLVPLPGYSPDFMPVEALWRWLCEDVKPRRLNASNERIWFPYIEHGKQSLSDRLSHCR
jgi:transposase